MVNVEEGLELENQHSITFIVKTDSGNKHQWMLNLGDMFDEEWDIYMVTKHFPRLHSSCKVTDSDDPVETSTSTWTG